MNQDQYSKINIAKADLETIIGQQSQAVNKILQDIKYKRIKKNTEIENHLSSLMYEVYTLSKITDELSTISSVTPRNLKQLTKNIIENTTNNGN